MEKSIFEKSTCNVTILVYTKSFLCQKNSFLYFENANKLNSIQIYYMPLLCASSKKLPISTGIYKNNVNNNRVFTSIQFSTLSTVVSTEYPADNSKTDAYFNQKAEAEILSGQAPDLFDYVVCSDEWCVEHKDHKFPVSFSECKEILRLFLVAKKDFALDEHHSCDEFTYYVYRHKFLFHGFQNFWSACCSHDQISDWAVALDNRLLLLSSCIDNAKIETYKLQTHTTAMHLAYHISYLLLLVTGTFDNLAWLINNLYNLELDKMKIDLLKREFHHAIKNKSSRLYNILSTTDFINKVTAIRELRDRVVHRNFIDTITVCMTDNQAKKCFLLDITARNKLITAGFPQNHFITTGKDSYALDIRCFIDFITMVITQVVDSILTSISVEIYQIQSHYIIWKLLEFPCEPYIL